MIEELSEQTLPIFMVCESLPHYTPQHHHAIPLLFSTPYYNITHIIMNMNCYKQNILSTLAIYNSLCCRLVFLKHVILRGKQQGKRLFALWEALQLLIVIPCNLIYLKWLSTLLSVSRFASPLISSRLLNILSLWPASNIFQG